MKNNGEKHKIWVLLVTCLATRAVWQDSILDLSTQTFLNALRRFIAKRGCPTYILSDNTTQFILASKTLDVTPSASWHGGCTIGCVDWQNGVKSAIGKRVLNMDEINTLIEKLKQFLTLDDNLDSIRALRPFDFLLDGAETGLPPLDSEVN